MWRQGSQVPMIHSSCEGELGIALVSLQVNRRHLGLCPENPPERLNDHNNNKDLSILGLGILEPRHRERQASPSLSFTVLCVPLSLRVARPCPLGLSIRSGGTGAGPELRRDGCVGAVRGDRAGQVSGMWEGQAGSDLPEPPTRALAHLTL